ncbi:MAG: 4-hydroxythreonine-4-phosphate dehydrogenase PdxA [Paracoccaceae bacterium]
MTPPKPVALTVGEPSGIGPEIALKAWDAIGQDTPFFLIADPAHLPADAITIIDHPSKTTAGQNLPVLPHSFAAANTPGQPAPENAAAVISAIARAVDLVQSGDASALTTNPIHKKALKDGADFAYPGHTEYLAALANVPRVVMMLASDTLRVVPTTIHIALKDVPKTLTADLLADTIRITHAALIENFGIQNPRLAIAGLNPHAGEGGVMGTEEITIIAPTIKTLQAEGLNITGTHSADTMFHAKARANYDAAICMYHDQALIPIKTLAFDEGVNVTLGLPFIRTSPDHGTAFDIAGKGIANPSSLIAAIHLAAKMAHT